MNHRRAALWLATNTAAILGVVAWTFARASVGLTGATAAGRGGLVPIGTLILSVLGALIVANLAWITVGMWKR